MRTYSTPQSALNGEITKLAILECVASAALYVGLGVYFGTFKYLALAVVFAPLMLFRTEFSADWGLLLYKRILALLEYLITKPERSGYSFVNITGFLAGVLLLVGVPVVAMVIRVTATVYWFVRRPIQTLKDAPQNWLRQCFCIDFAHPPEMVPKEASTDATDVFTFEDFLREIKSGKRQGREAGRIFTLIVAAPLLILGWLPSIIYRVSFKATALAYVPFVWVAHATLRNPLPVKARLERFTKGELEKVRRGASYIVLITIVAKGALVFDWIDRSYVESKFPSKKIATDLVVLDGWPWWQLTFAADALLTFFLLFFADAAVSRIEGQQPWHEESVMATVAATSFLRAAFGLITISHFFYLALVTAAPESVRWLLAF